VSYSNFNRLVPPLPLPKRNVFISSYHGDRSEVDAFIYKWATVENVFTPKALASFDNQAFINSDNPEYVMGVIRRDYIGDASVTIVLIGECTHSRRYVDWEIKASLTRGQSLPNGLLAYVLPSVRPWPNGLGGLTRNWPCSPDRFAANWNFFQQDKSYIRYYTMPESAVQLRQNIEDAFVDRTNRAHLIVNSAAMMKYNARCKVCGVTH
jgi:hypothetical protein